MKKNSFTLIELLIAILIIGILASIIFVGLDYAKGKARDARAKENMNQIRISAGKIYTTTGIYDSSQLCCGDTCSDEVKINCEEIKKMTGSYPEVFTDNGNSYCAKVQLNNGNWFCIDYQGRAIEAGSVNCSSSNYTCE